LLHEFLKGNRRELIERCRAKVSSRRAPRPTPDELEYGIPLFLDQLVGMLPPETVAVGACAPGRFGGAPLTGSTMEVGATRHGSELLRHGYTIQQVVHDYGDLCQSITELAVEQAVPISVHDFGILNITLDNAIAGAVAEFAVMREVRLADQHVLAMNERLGMMGHEMRNYLNTAILALAAIKGGGVGFTGATAGALNRSLLGMRELVDRTLAQVRLVGWESPSKERFDLAGFILDVEVAAALEASQLGCELTALPVEPGIVIEADRHTLAAAVTNLLQNAFKFTRKASHVLLRGHAVGERVLIEVQDECGGIPEDKLRTIFLPFVQSGRDRSGLGLGLQPPRRRGQWRKSPCSQCSRVRLRLHDRSPTERLIAARREAAAPARVGEHLRRGSPCATRARA